MDGVIVKEMSGIALGIEGEERFQSPQKTFQSIFSIFYCKIFKIYRILEWTTLYPPPNF